MPTTITRSGVRISQNENFSSYEDTMVEGEQTKIEVTDLVPDTTYYAKGLAEANNEIFVADNYIRFRTAQFQYDYLTFTASEESTVAMVHYGTNQTTTKPEIYYSFDKESWNTWDFEPIELAGGQSVYMYGDNPNGPNHGIGSYSNFVMTGTIMASGNVTTLVHHDGTNQLSLGAFAALFSGCSSLVTAPVLPSRVLADSCYYNMFANTSITQAPALPATTVYESCYSGMFYNCRQLVKAPALPATQAKAYCYSDMFKGCSSLTQAPQLPASVNATSCYSGMFAGCISLRRAPELRSTGAYYYCYQNMFRGCTSLVEPPSELPATSGYFDRAYEGMFQGCTSLPYSPIMRCTWLGRESCKNMFSGCTSLQKITCMLTDISAEGCLDGWVTDVAEDGVFYKNPNMEEWRTGTDGIPSGWAVEDYEA